MRSACENAVVERFVCIRMAVANISCQFADLSDDSAAATGRWPHYVTCTPRTVVSDAGFVKLLWMVITFFKLLLLIFANAIAATITQSQAIDVIKTNIRPLKKKRSAARLRLCVRVEPEAEAARAE